MREFKKKVWVHVYIIIYNKEFLKVWVQKPILSTNVRTRLKTSSQWKHSLGIINSMIFNDIVFKYQFWLVAFKKIFLQNLLCISIYRPVTLWQGPVGP